MNIIVRKTHSAPENPFSFCPFFVVKSQVIFTLNIPIWGHDSHSQTSLKIYKFIMINETVERFHVVVHNVKSGLHIHTLLCVCIKAGFSQRPILIKSLRSSMLHH